MRRTTGAVLAAAGLAGALGYRYHPRARLALHVLRGRPLAYRVTLRGQNVGMTITSPNTMIIECTVINDPPPGPSFEFGASAWGRSGKSDPLPHLWAMTQEEWDGAMNDAGLYIDDDGQIQEKP